MSSKPKAQDYKASEAEKTEAKVAAQKAMFFNKNYAPLNVMELRDSLSNDIRTWLGDGRMRMSCRVSPRILTTAKRKTLVTT